MLSNEIFKQYIEINNKTFDISLKIFKLNKFSKLISFCYLN